MNDLSNFWLPTLSKICPQLLSWDSQRVIAKYVMYVKRPAKKAKAVSGIMKSNDIKLGAQLAESDRIVAYCQTHCSKVSIEYFQKIGPKRRLGLLVLCQVFNQSCPWHEKQIKDDKSKLLGLRILRYAAAVESILFDSAPLESVVSLQLPVASWCFCSPKPGKDPDGPGNPGHSFRGCGSTDSPWIFAMGYYGIDQGPAFWWND